MKSNIQLKYSNYVAFSHFHGYAVNNPGLSLFLERKVNGSYGTYKIWEFTANNATSLSKTIDVAVPSGTYYRVRGYHAASQSGTKESTSTLTSGIMVK